MTSRPQHSPFDLYHPGVPALYLVAVLVLTMAAFHPVLLLASAVAGICCCAGRKGWATVARTLAWQLPLALIIALINPLVSAAGSTELLRLGTRAIYAESLLYGGCMGVMLIAVLQWFSYAGAIMTSDKLMALTGRRMPTLGLMLTMTMRLVPQFVTRGRQIATVQAANTAAHPASGPRERLRQTTVLMGWGMEDSLDTADAMRALGWGSANRRSCYARQEFRKADGLACAVLGLVIAACVAGAVMACSGFAFYPAVGPWAPWWCYAPFVLLLIVPALLRAGEAIRWR